MKMTFDEYYKKHSEDTRILNRITALEVFDNKCNILVLKLLVVLLLLFKFFVIVNNTVLYICVCVWYIYLLSIAFIFVELIVSFDSFIGFQYFINWILK